MNPAFLIKRSDNSYVINYSLVDDNSAVINLTNATVQFNAGNDTQIVVSKPAVITNALSGEVTVTLLAADTLFSGLYNAEFVVTFQDGTVLSYPRSGYISLNIQRNVDPTQLSMLPDGTSPLEVLNARGGYPDLNSRLNVIYNGASPLEVVNARNGYTDLNSRLGNTDTLLAEKANQADIIDITQNQLPAKADLNTVNSNLQVLNNVSQNLISGSWQSQSTADATVSVDGSNNIVITKLTANTAHIFVTLSQNVVNNQKYRVSVTAKTTDSSVLKNFFLRNPTTWASVGAAQKYSVGTDYTTCSFDLVATANMNAQLGISTSGMNVNEVLTISNITLQKLAIDPVNLDPSNIIQNGYSLNNTVWTSVTPSAISVLLNNNNLVLTKLTNTSGVHVTVPLTINVVAGKKYRLVITAQTSDTSVQKTFFLKNTSDGTSNGVTPAFSLTTSMATYTVDIVAINSGSCSLAISSTQLNTNEVITISNISLKQINVVAVNSAPPTNTVTYVTQAPRPVIWGTDWWTDVDDVMAARILCWAERMGMVDIVALGISACMNDSVTSLDAYFDFEGRPGLTIGIDEAATDYGGTPPYQTNMKTSRHTYNNNTEAEDAVSMYRRALANAKNPVDIIEVGYPQILSNLLKSPADNISSLTGMQLVTQKVNKLWMMAGNYPSGLENNFKRNARSISAGNYLCANWPTTITFLGYEVGSTVNSGGTLATVSPAADDLATKALADWNTANGNTTGNPRSSWDPMLTLLACYGDTALAGYSTVKGTNSVDPSTGANTFTQNDAGLHEYVVKLRTDNWYANQLNAILERKAWPARPLGAAQLPKV